MSSDNDLVVVLTALNVEYQAVRDRLDAPRVHWHAAGTRFETGRFGPHGCRIALGLVGKGNHPAAVLAERAITEFRPTAVLFVGVAGSLWPGVELGDVVVASQVYAYHGGTDEDDGLKARPKAWETAHEAAQIAQHLIRTGDWSAEPRPKVHYGPIAAGEIVQDSRVSQHAVWVRQHYNDALAIEMESAGVAQAAHLNRALPIVVIRGISDRADGHKAATDGQNWQPRAAAHAAAFGAALAKELVGARPSRRRDPHMDTAATFTNIAKDNARVGAQYGQVIGNATVSLGSGVELSSEFAAFRELLRKAHRDGRLDDAVFAAAEEELDTAEAGLDEDGGGKAAVAFKKLRGLVGDTAELATRLAAITALAEEWS
jgi:adenosylhomocysteine nucleosidase